MKNLLKVIVLFLSSAVFAQTGINYQILVRDNAGEPINQELVSFAVKILNGSSTEYIESHQVTSSKYGVCQFVIGKGTGTGKLEDVSWNSQNIRVQIDATVNGTALNISSISFEHVPYAFYALEAGSIEGIDFKNLSPQEGDVLTYEAGEWKALPSGATIVVTEQDTARWNGKLDTLQFKNTLASKITTKDTTRWGAGGLEITEQDTASWNAKLDSLQFVNSVASEITPADTARWGAGGLEITEQDTASWNAKLDTASLAGRITEEDTIRWGKQSPQVWDTTATGDRYTMNNVGVGIVPLHDFHFSGADAFFDAQYLYAGRGSNLGANRGLHFDAGANTSWELLTLENDNGVVLRANGDGKVGIGTSTPRGIFDVDGPGNIFLTDDEITSTSAQQLITPGYQLLVPYNGTDYSYIQAGRYDNSGSSHLVFRTQDAGTVVEGMHISPNGDVGIGMGANYKLDVNGPINATELRINGSLINTSGTSPWSGDASSAYVDNKKVGIGITSPAYDLHVDGVALVTERLQGGSAQMVASSAGSDDIAIFGSNSAVTPIIITRDAIETGNDLVIDKDGNVGIGTSTPRAKLMVQGYEANSTFGKVIAEFYADGTATYEGIKLSVPNTVTTGYNGEFNILPSTIPGGGEARHLTRFKTPSGANSNSTRHDVVIDGNVGVGTTAPDYQLVVDGKTSPVVVHWVRNGGVNGGALCIALASTGRDRPYITFNNYLTSEALFYGNDGNLRLGSASHINQSSGLDGGTIVGTQTSDRRLKTNITLLSNGISNVQALRPVSFYYKTDSTQKRIGFIAQEAQLVIPEVVYNTGNREINGVEEEDVLAMHYADITAVLVKATQEQQVIIDSQSVVIDSLLSLDKIRKTEINDVKTSTSQINESQEQKLSKQEAEIELLKSELAEIKRYLELEAKN